MDDLTLIVRCDQGGLANQTKQLYDRLKPATTIVVHVDPPRGEEHVDWYPDAIHVEHSRLNAHLLSALVRPGNTLLTCETFYCDVTSLTGVNKVVVANAELYDESEIAADRIIAPTVWELGRMPAGVTVLPHPQPKAPQSHFRIRSGEARRFLHMAAPAMLDRNGTQTLLQAAKLMKESVTFVMRAANTPSPVGVPTWKIRNVTIEWDDTAVTDWWENYPVECDALVIPRRYGGQCLPAQEAAACGMPNVMPDLCPQDEWPGQRFPAGSSQEARMKGGNFNVYYPDPVDVAATLDAMASGEVDLEHESIEAARWSHEIHWSSIGPRWEDFLSASR